MGRGLNILVVDDEPNMRTLLSEVLRMHGFHVCVAANGKDSLERMVTQEFDVVITDIKMPVLDGLEMLKQMKQANRKEKVIVMSATCPDITEGYPDLPQVVRQFEKPFQLDHLVSAVQDAVAPSGGLAAAV